MRIDFAFHDNSGNVRTIATAESPFLPRVGETVSLFGRAFGEGREQEGESVFEVAQVVWEVNADREVFDADVTVILSETDPPSFRPWCKCRPASEQAPDPDNPEQCHHCGDRLKQVPRG